MRTNIVGTLAGTYFSVLSKDLFKKYSMDEPIYWGKVNLTPILHSTKVNLSEELDDGNMLLLDRSLCTQGVLNTVYASFMPISDSFNILSKGMFLESGIALS